MKVDAAILLAQSQLMFDPASPGADSIRNLSILVLVITAFIFLLVEGILVYATIRFRGGGHHVGDHVPMVVVGIQRRKRRVNATTAPQPRKGRRRKDEG